MYLRVAIYHVGGSDTRGESVTGTGELGRNQIGLLKHEFVTVAQEDENGSKVVKA